VTLTFAPAYGAPAYGLRKGTEGICFHTDEGSYEPTLIGGKRLATWQASAGNTSGGSYNLIITPTGIVESVPVRQASGGISGLRDANWNPQPFLREGLSAAAVADPNAYLMNVCMLGRTAYYEANGWPSVMVDLAARVVLWLEEQPWADSDIFLCRHADWQRNRTDPGTRLIPAVMDRYRQLTEDDMALVYKPELWRAGASGVPLVDSTIPAGTIVFTVGESEDGTKRLAVVGDPERLEWVPRRSMTPLVAGGDPELHKGIARVVELRMNNQPVTIGDSVTLAQLREQVSTLTGRINAAKTALG
jgi:hypothetical protein